MIDRKRQSTSTSGFYVHILHTYLYMNMHTYIFKTSTTCQERNRAKSKMDMVPTLMELMLLMPPALSHDIMSSKALQSASQGRVPMGTALF